MAYDEGLAEILRGELQERQGMREKRMFGGLCFLLHGNMLCGVHKDGAMFRVGKEREAEALAIPGTKPMAFTGRRMGGMIDVDDATLADDDRRNRLLALAVDFVGRLPEKD